MTFGGYLVFFVVLHQETSSSAYSGRESGKAMLSNGTIPSTFTFRVQS